MKSKANSLDNRVLRDVALNREELLNHAIEIAQSHSQITMGPGKRTLLKRVKQNSEVIQSAYHAINEYAETHKDVVPAAEWFLDNYYVFSDLKKNIKKNLPRRFERELPSLGGEGQKEVPRVYILMRELVEHTDSQVNGDILKDYVNAYQKVQPLSSGELWALPIMLNMILLENIRRLSEQILNIQEERKKAEAWMAPLLEEDYEGAQWEEYISGQGLEEFSSAYGERLLQRIRDLGIEGAPLQRWFDRLLSKYDRSLEGLAHLEHQRQAQLQVSMGHAVTSIRFVAEENWSRFYEDISPVQRLLEQDPSGIFPAMDFKSRDHYRHKVEKLAKVFGVSELVIANKVLERAHKRQEQGERAAAHVGYDLLGPGYPDLEKELEGEWGQLRRLWCNWKRYIKNKPLEFYLGGIGLSSGVLLLLLAWPLFVQPLNWGIRLLTLAVLLVTLLGIVIPFFNWLVARLVQPAFLPKLEFRQGIPEELSTMVVIPTLLPSAQRVRELLAEMEIYYLANKEKNIYFGLLGDFCDGVTPTAEGDEEIIAEALSGIKALNQKYDPVFFSFIAADFGIRRRRPGWGGSASAGSCWNSISCSGSNPIPAILFKAAG